MSPYNLMAVSAWATRLGLRSVIRDILDAKPVTVAVGRLAPLPLCGLAETPADDHRVRVFAPEQLDHDATPPRNG